MQKFHINRLKKEKSRLSELNRKSKILKNKLNLCSKAIKEQSNIVKNIISSIKSESAPLYQTELSLVTILSNLIGIGQDCANICQSYTNSKICLECGQLYYGTVCLYCNDRAEWIIQGTQNYLYYDHYWDLNGMIDEETCQFIIYPSSFSSIDQEIIDYWKSFLPVNKSLLNVNDDNANKTNVIDIQSFNNIHILDKMTIIPSGMKLTFNRLVSKRIEIEDDYDQFVDSSIKEIDSIKFEEMNQQVQNEMTNITISLSN